MTSSNLQEVRDELVDLFDRQLNILEDEVFGVATKSELVEYEDKRDRIHKLYEQLLRKRVQ